MKITVFNNSTLSRRNLRDYTYIPYNSSNQNHQSTFATDSIGLSWFRFFSGKLRKTFSFCKSALWPFNVIQGHWF